MAISDAVTTFFVNVTAQSPHSLTASWHIIYNAIVPTHNGFTNGVPGK